MSCSVSLDYDKEGLERSRQAWQSRLDTLPIGATTAQLTQWLKDNDLKAPPSFKNGYYNSNLPNGHFAVRHHAYRFSPCDSFFLALEIQLDAQQKVQNKELSARGSCL